MARNEDMERRLRNWGRWRASMGMGGVGNYARCDMTQERVDGGGGFDAPLAIPITDDEAARTDVAVEALEAGLRDAVHAVYVKGGTMREKATRLGIAEATVYARIDQAHRRLAAWFSAEAQAQRDHRARMEALQASARSGAR
ncbi:MAG: hypothetical protein KF788_08765 [Piscinibacter sp.]|nr:hypothetical protein [Piscinibacter sp.]